jgi:hypothetical protein
VAISEAWDQLVPTLNGRCRELRAAVPVVVPLPAFFTSLFRRLTGCRAGLISAAAQALLGRYRRSYGFQALLYPCKV